MGGTEVGDLESREIAVYQRGEDGYFNATGMCKKANKLWANYQRNSTTKAFLKALSSDMRIRIDELIQSLTGGKEAGGGTWVHPLVAIHLGQWISPKYAVAVVKLVAAWQEVDRKGTPVVYRQTQEVAELTDAVRIAERTIRQYNELASLAQSREAKILGYIGQAADSFEKYRTVDAELDLERKQHIWTKAQLDAAVRAIEAAEAALKNGRKIYKEKMKSARSQGFEEGFRKGQEHRHPELREENAGLREQIKKIFEKWRQAQGVPYSVRRNAIRELDPALRAEIEANDATAKQKFEVISGGKGNQ